MAMTLDELVTQLKAAYGADLRSVVLYGSAAANEQLPKRSDLNVLVIVESLPLERLRAAAAVARAWADAGNPPPMTMTASEWRTSSDIFPMEYADVLERHRVLHGEAPFDGISVRTEDLRLQLEHEAMGKLLRLRQGVLAAGGDGKRQAELLSASFSTFMTIFRAVLRLHGETPPAGHAALIDAVAYRAGLDPAPFQTAARHARGEQPLTGDAVGATLAGYLRGVEALVAHVDTFSPAR